MAAARNPKATLISLVACVVLFGVFAAISQLHVLERHAYVPAFGWRWPFDTVPGRHDICVSTVTGGFPLATTRVAESPVECLKATNDLARALNYAFYFAAGTIGAVAVAEGVKEHV